MTFQTQNLTEFQIGFDINFRIRRKGTVKPGKVIQKNDQYDRRKTQLSLYPV